MITLALTAFRSSAKHSIFEDVNERVTAKYKTLPRPEVLTSHDHTMENCILESARNDVGKTTPSMLEPISKDMMRISDDVSICRCLWL